MRNWRGLTAGDRGGSTSRSALLACCAVFAATAGPRRRWSPGRRRCGRRSPPPRRSPGHHRLTATGTPWRAALAEREPRRGVPVSNLTAAQVTEITGQLHADFDHGVVSLAPPGTDWASLTTGPNLVQSALPAVGGIPVKLELTDRQPLSQHMRLVAGHFPAAPPARGPQDPLSPRFFTGGSLLSTRCSRSR